MWLNDRRPPVRSREAKSDHDGDRVVSFRTADDLPGGPHSLRSLRLGAQDRLREMHWLFQSSPDQNASNNQPFGSMSAERSAVVRTGTTMIHENAAA